MADPTTLLSSGLVNGAYSSSKSLSGGAGAIPNGQESNGFAKMVAEAAENAVQTVRTGEATAAAGIKGEATTQEVVEAVLAMQSTVEVAVSVRDRFVEAYQEILRMPI